MKDIVVGFIAILIMLWLVVYGSISDFWFWSVVAIGVILLLAAVSCGRDDVDYSDQRDLNW